jgi:alpha/beta hydrolase fold
MPIVHRCVARSAFPFTRGWCSLAEVIVAAMTLRFGPLRVRTTVRWPQVETVSLALVLTDELSPADSRVENCVVVGLTAGLPGPTELAALQWVAEHVPEFGAERDRILVAGGARAARLALAARDSGWPVLQRQLLVHPSFTREQPMPVNVAGAPPATVVVGRNNQGGRRYAERLRAAGVEVDEVCDAGRR